MAAGRPTVVVDDRRTHPPTGVAADLATDDVLVDELAGLLAAVLAAEDAPGEAEAGLHLVDRDEIHDLNLRHMGVDGPTDVLSFPLDGTEADAAIVGDVVLCSEVAAEQAEGHAGEYADECRLLVVHGALHLAGWDHADAADRDAMWARERELMEDLGVPPIGEPWSSEEDA